MRLPPISAEARRANDARAELSAVEHELGAVREILERLNEPAAGPADGDADAWSDEEGASPVSAPGYSSSAMHNRMLCEGMVAVQEFRKSRASQ